MTARVHLSWLNAHALGMTGSVVWVARNAGHHGFMAVDVETQSIIWEDHDPKQGGYTCRDGRLIR